MLTQKIETQIVVYMLYTGIESLCIAEAGGCRRYTDNEHLDLLDHYRIISLVPFYYFDCRSLT